MLEISSAQLYVWLAAYFYPAVRILALLATAPVFNNVALPRKIRLAIGLGLTLALGSALPVSEAAVVPSSWLVITAVAREAIIGYAMGFTVRLVFAAVDMAGNLIGLQMGLSFAAFFDPQTAGQTGVVAQFLGMFSTLTFLALNGHLLILDVLAQSFVWLPAGEERLHGEGFMVILRTATLVFSAGLLIALPAVAALLITNIALGVLTRAAPQLNLFSLGFPITLAVGTVAMALSLPRFAPAFSSLYENAFDATAQLLRVLAGP